MTQLSVGKLIGLTFVTFGIYGLMWLVRTRGEMVAQGADIPSPWLLIVPIANIVFMWKWAGGVEQVSGGSSSQVSTFLLVGLLSVFGMAIVQSRFNKALGAGTGGPAVAPA